MRTVHLNAFHREPHFFTKNRRLLLQTEINNKTQLQCKIMNNNVTISNSLAVHKPHQTIWGSTPQRVEQFCSQNVHTVSPWDRCRKNKAAN